MFLGLAADAAWDARQDRSLEARYVRGLLSEADQRARGFVDAHLIPALAARGDVGHVLMNQWASVAVAQLDPDGMTPIQGDSELKALVSQRYTNAAMACRGRESLGAAVDSLMAAIQRSVVPEG